MFLLLFSKTVRRLIAAVVLALLALVTYTAGKVVHVGRQDARPPSDAIVVLGAAQFDGRPSLVFQSRLDHAANLFEDEVAPLVVTVGGGAPGDRFTEAEAGETYLRRKGVSETLSIDEGRDTLESLQALKRVLDRRGMRSVVLVTDPWHSLRSRTMARDLGLEAETSPTRTGPTVLTRATKARYFAREVGGYLYYKLKSGQL